MPTDSRIDIISSLNPRESKDEVIERLERMVFEALNHDVWQRARDHMSRDYQFWEGDQWSPEELQELQDRGQPDTVFNEVKPKVERVHGQISEAFQTVKFIGRNFVDEGGANTYSDILRWIDQRNQAEFVESDTIQDMIVSGFAVQDIDVDEDDDGQPIVVEKCRDALNHIYPDPFSRSYDWNDDARYIIEAPWMDLEDAIALWPDKRSELESCISPHTEFEQSGVDPLQQNERFKQIVDVARRRLRPAKVWYKRKAKRFDILDDQGQVVPIGVPLDRKDANQIVEKLKGFSLREKFINEMWVGVYCWRTLIHHELSPHEHGLFPYVPYWGWRKKDGEPYGIVRNLIPINEAINKRESKALHLLTNRQIRYEKGTIEDIAAAQEANARPDGMIEVQEGALANNRVEFPDNQELGQAQMAMHQNARDVFQEVSGLDPRSSGLSPEIRSGVGVQRQQRIGDLTLSRLLTNVRRSRRMKARLKYEYIRQYFTDDMVFQITDDPEKPKQVEITAGRLDALRDLKYDIVMVDEQDHHTTRAEQRTLLFTSLPQVLPMGAAWVKLFIQMSDLRDKEQLLSLVDAINEPPPAQPKMSMTFSYGDMDAIERAQFWMMMKNPQMAQHLIQNLPDSALIKKLKADIAQTLIQEGTKAMLERGKSDQRAEEIAVEGIFKALELDEEKRARLNLGPRGSGQFASQLSEGGDNAKT